MCLVHLVGGVGVYEIERCIRFVEDVLLAVDIHLLVKAIKALNTHIYCVPLLVLIIASRTYSS